MTEHPRQMAEAMMEVMESITRAEQNRETLPQLLGELEADHGPEAAALLLRFVYGDLPARYRRPGVKPQ